MPKLTAKSAAAKTAPGMYGDGNGLYLNIKPSGARSWILRTTMQGRRGEMGLGSVRDEKNPAGQLSLSEARERAAEERRIARAGGDPIEERKARRKAAIAAKRDAEARAKRRAVTFLDAAERLHGKLRPKWKNAKHAETWLASIRLHVGPVFGAKPVEDVTGEDARKVLEPLTLTNPETAKRLRQRIAAVIDWATAENLRTGENPVSVIKRVLPEVKATREHLAAMPWRDVPAFYASLGEREGMSATCLRFIILTASRSGEARGARWDEIDAIGAAWNIPGARMKRGEPHRVPLSDEAMSIITATRGLDPVYVFPSSQSARDGTARPMSDMAFKLLYSRMQVEGFTTHGFRSAFRDWCSEAAKADPELAEAALSHATGNAVTRAYARSDLFDRRRALMEAWSQYVTGAAGQVVRMVRA